MTAYDYAHQHAEQFRRELYDLLRIPSVSTDPDFAPECQRAADWLVDHLRGIGLTAERIDTARHPLVAAEWLGAGDAPTVLIYGHYDVQPAVREDGWDSDPFEPVEREGKMVARGSTDDKGQFFAHIKAVESLLKAECKLPVNVRFIIEGEEESGSGSIKTFVNNHPDKLRAAVCVISDGSMAHLDEPVIVYSLRGGMVFEIHITGPSQDLHSGMFGGTVHNPALALAEMLTKMHLPDGRVAVPGFYDNVRPLSDDERRLMAQLEWTEDEWRSVTGAPQPWGENGYTLLERIGARPTLEITGMTSGYVGNGFKSIVPGKAIAKISCRLVPNQDPQRVFEVVREYITRITPPTVTSEITWGRGFPASEVDLQHPAMQVAVRAYERGWGARPVFKREGGSIPIVGDFQQVLGLPVVMMGFGLDSDGLHGPNEHYSIAMFERGIATSIAFLEEAASL